LHTGSEIVHIGTEVHHIIVNVVVGADVLFIFIFHVQVIVLLLIMGGYEKVSGDSVQAGS